MSQAGCGCGAGGQLLQYRAIGIDKAHEVMTVDYSARKAESRPPIKRPIHPCNSYRAASQYSALCISQHGSNLGNRYLRHSALHSFLLRTSSDFLSFQRASWFAGISEVMSLSIFSNMLVSLPCHDDSQDISTDV